ncbi:MAG: AAA family ATPase [Brevirhabdus sp.]
MGSAPLEPEEIPVLACTIARDIQDFEILIEEMEAELGERWGDLDFDDAAEFFSQEEASELEFVVLAVDAEDEARMTEICSLIQTSKDVGINVILITHDISPATLHQLLRIGANDFLPYPLPDGALHEAIERIRQASQPEAEVMQFQVNQPSAPNAQTDRRGSVFAVHGLAGGTGASTFATNLAWELLISDKNDKPGVCILDLDLQFGSISTYLDLPRRESVFELLSELESSDPQSFHQALVTFENDLNVLTSPNDIIPLDLIGPDDVAQLIEYARSQFDYVIIDMPSTLVAWTEAVLEASDIYFSMVELDMRSAQNTLRMIRALKAEDLPVAKLRYVMNRAPGFTDLSGKSRIKRMAESLDINIEVQLPDGGKQVLQGCDHGMPLAMTAAKNPLRKEIAKLAKSIRDVASYDIAAE